MGLDLWILFVDLVIVFDIAVFDLVVWILIVGSRSLGIIVGSFVVL